MKFDWKFYLGLVIGFLFLYLSLKGFRYAEFIEQIESINWYLIVLSVIIYYLTYVSRVLRWRYLTAPIKEGMSFRNLFSAISIGFGANNMLPFRLGELARAYALGKIEKVSAGSVLATVVIERVFDGMAVIGLVVIILLGPTSEHFSEHNQALRTAGYSSLVFLIFIVGFLVLLEKKTDKAIKLMSFFVRPVSKKLQDKMEKFLISFAAGIDVLYRGGALLMIVLYSILTWVLIIFFYYTIILSFSFGSDIPFSASVAVVVFIAFASVIPAPPGYVGTFEAGGIAALMIYGLAKTQAAGVVIVMHALNIFPAIIMGLVFLWLDKISLAEASRVSADEIEGVGKKEL
jgi:glycosyltransferase 2 family protein